MDEKLSNEPIDVADLPRLRPEPYVPVDPRHVLGSVAFWAVAAAVAFVGAMVIANQTDEAIWLWIGVGVALLMLIASGWTWAAARAISYQVRDHDLSLRSGLVQRTEATVPFRRVQHVDLSRGVLDRTLGLSTLSINSAGPDISVPGLPADTATTLREWIVSRADIDDDVERVETVEATAPPEVVEPEADAAPEPNAQDHRSLDGDTPSS